MLCYAMLCYGTYLFFWPPDNASASTGSKHGRLGGGRKGIERERRVKERAKRESKKKGEEYSLAKGSGRGESRKEPRERVKKREREYSLAKIAASLSRGHIAEASTLFDTVEGKGGEGRGRIQWINNRFLKERLSDHSHSKFWNVCLPAPL